MQNGNNMYYTKYFFFISNFGSKWGVSPLIYSLPANNVYYGKPNNVLNVYVYVCVCTCVCVYVCGM